MPAAVLTLGTKRYSSWSMRGWLAVRLAGLEVEERVIPLAGGMTPAVRRSTPAGLVPVLQHEGATLWESLAIGEYCAELAPRLWPEERIARAHARAIAAEMHAGFRALRLAMPMVLGRDATPRTPPADATADLARIEQIWAETRARFGGSGAYLFGHDFTLADAMYAPVVARCLTYRPPLSAASLAYCAALRAHPLVSRWYDEAAAEPASWRLAKYEQA